MYLSPLWRLKGDHYLDTVPRLNDWNGMEKALSQLRARHLPSQGDMNSSQGGMKSDAVFTFRCQCHLMFGVIFSYFQNVISKCLFLVSIVTSATSTFDV